MATMRRRAGLVGAMAVAGLAPVLTVGSSEASAAAAALPPQYAQYANCPVDVAKVKYCLAASSSSTFTINSTTLASNGPVLLTLGLVPKKHGTFAVVLPDNGTSALVAQPINVPGGLLGIPGSGIGPLAVTATPELVGTPQFSLTNLELKRGPALVLPIGVSLGNPLLGASCAIGTASNPITLNLTDGTTSPPPPNTPITGALTSVTVDPQGVLTTVETLVDNAFAVPGASGCGLFGLFDPIVNAQKNLPSAAGMNSAVLSSTAGLAPASVIRQYLG